MWGETASSTGMVFWDATSHKYRRLDEDPPDEAGVREPRRPKNGPPELEMSLPVDGASSGRVDHGDQ